MVIADFRAYYSIGMEAMLDLGWREFITLLVGLGSETRWQQWRSYGRDKEEKAATGGGGDGLDLLVGLTSLPGELI